MGAEQRVAAEKEHAEKVSPPPAPAPAPSPKRKIWSAVFQAVEMAGIAGVPTGPSGPIDGLSAAGQSSEVLGGAQQMGSPSRAAAQADEVSMRNRVLDSEADGGERKPTHPSERRRLPELQAEIEATIATLVAQATAAFGMASGSVEAHVTDGGPAAARGTRGMMAGGSIFLDASSFDPQSMDGRQLVGHEVAHAGQRGLPGLGSDAIGMAEAEAHLFGERFARGEQTGPLRAGLPSGHTAHENGGGSNVGQLITQYQQTIDANSSTVTPVANTPPSAGSGTATQNHSRKVEQYTGGVDGIADQIGGLAAFDDLCDAFGLLGDGETSGPLGRIKSSGPYRELTRMWQGAKEGGEDSSAMMAAFSNEFNGRGFWGSTEQAFDLIESHAKADAAPEPEAAGARGDLQTAGGAEDAAQSALDAAGGEAGGAAAGAGPAGGPGADMAALMNAPVADAVPQIADFETMAGITDGDLGELLTQARHQASFSERSGEFEGRGSQILETFGENFLGSFVQSGTDQLMDGLIFDNIGFLGDQGLKLLTKGRLGTPMIGPLIGLAQSPPWTADAWGGSQFTSSFESFGNIGATLDGFEHAQDVGDYVGIFAALFADFFGGLRDLLDALATIAGTLSALCYVVGGVLILVGLALLWLAGVGAPLITAGGWLTRVAGILGRINSALGPIVLVLSALTAMFRAAAAYMVPAEMYASQLQGVGQAAGTFGDKTGAKVADMTAEAVNEHIQGPIANRVDGQIADSAAGDDGGASADVEPALQEIDDGRQALEDDAADTPDPERVQDGDDPERVQDGDDPERVQDGDVDASPRSRARRLLSAIERVPLVGEVVRSGQDLISAIGNPRQAAIEGLSPYLRDRVDQSLEGQVRDQIAHVQQIQEQIQGIDGPIAEADRSRLVGEFEAANQALQSTRDRLEQTRATIAEVEAAEQRAREERDREPDENETPDEDIQALQEHGDDLRDQLRQAQDDLASKRPEVQERIRQIQEDITRIQQERSQAQETLQAAESDADTASETRRQELRAEADRLMSEMTQLTDEATRLDRQADAAERAQTLRTEADASERAAESAQAQAQTQRQTMENHVGTRIKLTDHAGETANGMIDRRVVAVTDTGVVIAEGQGGTQRTVPFSDIRYPVALREAAQQFQEASSTAQQAQSDAETQRTTAAGLAAEGTDPSALRAQAQTERTNANNLQGDHEAANTAAMGNTTPTENRSQVSSAQEAVRSQDSEIASRQADIEAASREVTDLESQKQSLNDQVRTNDARLAEVRRTQNLNEFHGLMNGSSGNATGGVGSSNAVWGEWLVRKLGLFDQMLGTVAACGGDVAALQALPQSEQTTGAAVEQMVLGGAGITVETQAQLQQIGERRAAIEAMLALAPPSDPAQLSEHRNAAIAAYEEYSLAHARAARAYHAEQIVDGLSQETAQLAVAGEPIRERSASMAAPLAGSRADEDARASTLGGGGEVTPASDPAGGIVGELIMKLASHGDSMDEQPTPPSEDAGAQIDEGQAVAATEGTERSVQSLDASGQQRAFLDAAIVARVEQEQQVCTDITLIENKHQEEVGIKEGIQQQKAQALLERNQHQTTVQTEASAFNAEYEALLAWRIRYEARRRAAGES